MAVKDDAIERPFGRRNEPHKIIIAREGRSRSFTVRPWMLGITAVVAVTVGAGYLAATGYLFYRDQILANREASQAQMQHRYEDRIASLRAEIDRITSRQLIDKEVVEAKIDLLLDRKNALDHRGEMLAGLLDRARGVGIAAPIAGPLPEPKPATTDEAAPKADRADITGSIAPATAAAAISAVAGVADTPQAEASPLSFAEEMGLRTSDASFLEPEPNNSVAQAGAPTSLDKAAMLPEISVIEQDFAMLEAQQATTVALLAEKTSQKVQQIRKTLNGLGYDADKLVGKSRGNEAVGGPFVPLANIGALPFDEQVDTVARSLADLDKLRKRLDIVPLARPIRGAARTTSRYGVRIDPFLGTPALHAGIDFKAPTGHPIVATARGKVVRAGRSGGYGKMVEIDHGNGVTTRYAHLSAILVSEGDKVDVGQVIGKLGSSGRSTGPHLHYETRVNGAPVNPARFLEAGRRIRNAI